MATSTPLKSERIDVRASVSVKQLLQEAAQASHKSVSEFLLDAGITAANVAHVANAAEVYPSRPIRVIVPLPPGTATDFISRTLAVPLGDQYKQQIVVDNRPGAGGLIGSGLGAKATPDGYTYVMPATGVKSLTG